MNMNPRQLHFLLELGSVATGATTVLGFAGHLPLPAPWNLVVSGLSAAATALLSWQKAAVATAGNPNS